MSEPFPQTVCDSCHDEVEDFVESICIGITFDVDPPPTYPPCNICHQELSGDCYYSISSVRCSTEIATEIQAMVRACEESGCGRIWDSSDEEWLFDELNNDLLNIFNTITQRTREQTGYHRLLELIHERGTLECIELPTIHCPKCMVEFHDWNQEVKTRMTRRIANVPTLPEAISALAPASTSPAEIIEFYRSDCSNGLIHLTKPAEIEYFSSNIEGESQSREFTAQEVLFVILSQRTLRAFEGKGLHASAVCFTEKPLTALKDTLLGKEAAVRKSNHAIEWAPYGLLFPKDYLRRIGAAPVLHLNATEEQKLPSELLHRVVPFRAGSDWNHEREWRYGSDLRFDATQVVVLLARFEQIKPFQDALENAQIRVKGFLPLLDLFACM